MTDPNDARMQAYDDDLDPPETVEEHDGYADDRRDEQFDNEEENYK